MPLNQRQRRLDRSDGPPDEGALRSRRVTPPARTTDATLLEYYVTVLILSTIYIYIYIYILINKLIN